MSQPISSRLPAVSLLLLVAACASDAAAERGCRVLQGATPLPAGLEESSGVVVGRARELLWTHNDSGGDPVLYALAPDGRLVAEVEVEGARAGDWEDLAIGPCPSGNCLLIGDIGDNEAERDQVVLYRVPEPTEANPVRAERFRVRYPGGPRDAEALLALPSGEVLVVTKGREEPVAVYRYPLPLRADETVTLEPVVELSSGPREPSAQVTGAAASPSGEWIAIRTYRSLALFRASDLLAGSSAPARVFDLSALGEAQGEAVALLDDGRVILTSEGGFKDSPATLRVLQCPLAAAGPTDPF